LPKPYAIAKESRHCSLLQNWRYSLLCNKKPAFEAGFLTSISSTAKPFARFKRHVKKSFSAAVFLRTVSLQIYCRFCAKIRSNRQILQQRLALDGRCNFCGTSIANLKQFAAKLAPFFPFATQKKGRSSRPKNYKKNNCQSAV